MVKKLCFFPDLKKVTADMQTHKNPTLRTGPAPFKAPQYSIHENKSNLQQQENKPPVFTRDGKKWLIVSLFFLLVLIF